MRRTKAERRRQRWCGWLIATACALVLVACEGHADEALPPLPDPASMDEPMRAAFLVLRSADPLDEAAITRFLFINERVDAAAAWLAHLRQTRPDEAEWLYLSARHAANYGNPEDAERWLDDAYKRAPTAVAVAWDRARMHRFKGDRETARAILLALAKMVPDSPYGLYGLGQLALDDGDPTRAAEIATQLRIRFPDSPLGYLLTAAAASAMGDTEATAQWNAAASARGRFLEPSSPWVDALYAHCYLPYGLEVQGALLRERRRFDEAEAILRRARQLAPERAGIALELGNVYYETGQGEACRAAFLEAITLDPKLAGAYPALAQATERFGGIETLENALRTGVRVLPDFPFIHQQLGEIELRNDQPEAALACFQEAVRLDPEAREAWEGLAESARRTNRRETFIAALDGFTARFGDDPAVRATCGNAFLRLQLWSRVDNLYARRQREPISDIHAALEQALNATRAQAWWHGYVGFRSILDVSPEHPTALFNLGNLYCAHGACDRALPLFERLFATSAGSPARQRFVAGKALVQAAVEVARWDRAHAVMALLEHLVCADPSREAELCAAWEELMHHVLEAELTGGQSNDTPVETLPSGPPPRSPQPAR